MPGVANLPMRQSLGLIKFMGELFKMQMLTEHIMHKSINELLANVEDPEEEEIEGLCLLLTTVGLQIDTPNARRHMDGYFACMRGLMNKPNVNLRMRTMLQDVIDLRDHKWLADDETAVSDSAATTHMQDTVIAAREESGYSHVSEAFCGEFLCSGHGSHLSDVDADGWSDVRAPTLPSIRTISSSEVEVGGPSPSTEASGVAFEADKSANIPAKDQQQQEALSSWVLSSVASESMDSPKYAIEYAAAESESSQTYCRKASVGAAHTVVPEGNSTTAEEPSPGIRRRLGPPQSDLGALSIFDVHTPNVNRLRMTPMTEQLKLQLSDNLKGFFEVRDLDEGEAYCRKLSSRHRWRLVDMLVLYAVVSARAVDARLVGDLFARAAKQDFISPDAFDDGFSPTLENLHVFALHTPNAASILAVMLKKAQLDSARLHTLIRRTAGSDYDMLVGLLL
ncbi:uncharacterized protein B0H18DRAFT_1053546 [Fomitopsis serialis]|uniref:uncharacterized protein n=1 Tax=Fomitopsis serialis TaxID=139415 RepID=UPI0020088A0D|nr:uncharacterized protein B0H18DRAFT_1053546 [Neoantrodia serialis]KAH9912527.1 hypothetical protein B0H18DRAFT_1053546 [Neoantrodia serialis]